MHGTWQHHSNNPIIFNKKNTSVDLAFQLMRFPLDGELDFTLKMILLFEK